MIRHAKDFGEMVAKARKSHGINQRKFAFAIAPGERFIVELIEGKPTAQLGKALGAAHAVRLRLGDSTSLSRKDGA